MESPDANNFNDKIKMKKITLDLLLARLVKAGELFVLGDEMDEVDSYLHLFTNEVKMPAGYRKQMKYFFEHKMYPKGWR